MPEKHIPARADIFKSYTRNAVLSVGALALALTVTDSAPTSANNEILLVSPATVSSKTVDVLSPAYSTDSRQQQRPSRSVERKAISDPYCWYGTKSEIYTATGGDRIMTKKRMANIAIACELAVDQKWYGAEYKTEIQSLVKLWDRESGWEVDNKYGNAYGIPQALPGKKMAKAGKDWRTNPKTQIEWGFDYIEQRYKSPKNAWNNFQEHNSY